MDQSVLTERKIHNQLVMSPSAGLRDIHNLALELGKQHPKPDLSSWSRHHSLELMMTVSDLADALGNYFRNGPLSVTRVTDLFPVIEAASWSGSLRDLTEADLGRYALQQVGRITEAHLDISGAKHGLVRIRDFPDQTRTALAATRFQHATRELRIRKDDRFVSTKTAHGVSRPQAVKQTDYTGGITS